MRRKLFFIAIFSVVLFSACRREYKVTSLVGEPVLIDSLYDVEGSSPMKTLVESYKHKLDAEMQVVVGEAAKDLTFGVPESPLTNLTSEVLLDQAKKLTKGKCDLALMNVNGHRANISAGKITLGNLYEVYSFDNSLVILKIKGKFLTQVFESYAQKGGGGTSGNVKAVITADKKLESLKINRQEIDPEKIYTVATLDYLAEGNDGMEALKKAESIESTGLILRDLMIDYVTTQSKKGKEIIPVLDGRITLKP